MELLYRTGEVYKWWQVYNIRLSPSKADMTSTWYTTNDATFEITGVQLEVGEVVSPLLNTALWQRNLHFANVIIRRFQMMRWSSTYYMGLIMYFF